MPWMKTFHTIDSGTTDGTTASKLVDSTQNFLTTVTAQLIVYNTTDLTFTYVTAVDDNSTLSVNDDIFTSGEDYTIYGTPALPDGWVECNGQVISDSDSPYDGATIPDLNGSIKDNGINTGITDTTITDSTKSWTTNEWAGYVVEITSGAGIGQTREIASNTATALTFADTGDWAINPSTSINYQIHGGRRFLRGNVVSGGSGLGGGAWHRITVAELASHNHTTVPAENNPSGAGYEGTAQGVSYTGSTGGDDIFDNRPPYYEVVYIMRIK